MSDDALNALYPFLSGGKADPGRRQAALLESIRQKAADGIREVESDYPRHAAAARALAEDYFDAGKVLGRLVDEAMEGRRLER